MRDLQYNLYPLYTDMCCALYVVHGGESWHVLEPRFGEQRVWKNVLIDNVFVSIKNNEITQNVYC